MTENAASTSGKSLRGRLLALGLGCVLAFGVGEAFARAKYGAPWPERMPLLRIQAHPTRGWEMVPGEDHYTYDSLVRVNSLGLRGPELEPKREGETRVLVLGDSLTYGQGMGETETLPAQTEARLREDGGDWTVVNGGLRAYATNQELALLEELASEVEPDVVVLAWYWNDLIDSNVEGNFERFAKTGPVTFDLSVPAEGMALWKWRAKQLVRRSALLMQLYDLVPKTKRESALDVERRPELLARFTEHLERFQALADEHDFHFGVFLVPDSNTVVIETQHPSLALTLDVDRLLKERGVPNCDMRDVLLLTTGFASRIIPFDGHYDAEGNARLARGLADFVRELTSPPAEPAPED